MSVSSTANSSNSSVSSPTSTRPVSITSSPVMMDDNQISTSDDERDSNEKKCKLDLKDDTLGKIQEDLLVVEKRPRLGENPKVFELKLEAVEENEHAMAKDQSDRQTKLEQKVEESKPMSKALAPVPTVKCQTSSDAKGTSAEQQASDQVKSASSIVRLTPIQNSQLVTGSNLPLIVRGHIVDNKQHYGQDNRVITNIISTTTTPATAFVIPSPSSQKIAISAPNSNNNNQDNMCKLSTNNVVRLEATTSGCSTLSKTSASTSSGAHKKPTSSRPDLVASSISSLQTIPIGAKTRPLLMNHNYRHNQLHGGGTLAASAPVATTTTTTTTATSTVSSESASSKIIHSLQNQTIATTLSPQLILSSIITANPGHKVQQISTIGGHSGLQFCLTPHQASQLAKFTPNTVNLVDTSISSIPGTSKQPSSTNTSSASTSASITKEPKTNTETTTATTTAITNSPKSKLKANIPSGASSTQASLDNPTPAPSASNGGVKEQQSNAAAARLLDLGKKLLEATRECKVDLVRHLVNDAGAPFTSDWLGTTALHIAAQNGSSDIAEILIRAGVNRDARTKLERTALHMAAQAGSLEVVNLLVSNGSDVNGRDMLKMTPLHWAVERGHVSVVERLLMAGADYKIKSKFQLTPVDMAREANLLGILELFRNWASGTREAESLDVYRELEATLDESHEFLDIDYHLALVDDAANSRDDSMLDTEEPCGIDLAALEWNKFDDFEPELFLPNEGGEQHVQKVGYLMKVVEELQRENQQLRQKVEQLSTTDQ